MLKVLMAALIGLSGAALADGAPKVDAAAPVGQWTVTDEACATCKGGDKPELGQTVSIGPDKLVDPFGAGCDGPPDAGPARRVRFGAVGKEIGLPAAWAAKRAAPSATVTDTQIGCRGLSTMRLILISPDLALYPQESGVTLELRRR